MPKIERFEDLQSWQKARQLANVVYDLTRRPAFAKDFQLRDQIRDAAGSVMHNIAEGSIRAHVPSLYGFSKLLGDLAVKCNPSYIWLSIRGTSRPNNSSPPTS